MREIIEKFEQPKEVVELHKFTGTPSNIYIAVLEDCGRIYKLSYFQKYHWRPLYRTDSGVLAIGEDSSLESIITRAVEKRGVRVYEFTDIKEFAKWLVEEVK